MIEEKNVEHKVEHKKDSSDVEKEVDILKDKEVLNELREIAKIIKGEKTKLFFQEPIILDKYQFIVEKVVEAFESLSKFASYYLRRTVCQRFGVKLEFATAIRWNEKKMPCLYIELLDVLFPEDFERRKDVMEKVEKSGGK